MGLTVIHRFLEILAAPAVLCEPCGMHFYCVKLCRTFRNLLFRSNFCSHIASLHDTRTRQAHDLQVWCFFFLVFWWGQTYVHLIRWNLKAVYANWGKTWPRSRQGNNARPLGFFRNWVLFDNFVVSFFSPTSPHWSLITLLLASR